MKVVSSNIDEVEHDSSTSTLKVTFKNGSRYKYDEVPQVVFEQLISAESVGKALNQMVKGKFAYTKLGA